MLTSEESDEIDHRPNMFLDRLTSPTFNLE